MNRAIHAKFTKAPISLAYIDRSVHGYSDRDFPRVKPDFAKLCESPPMRDVIRIRARRAMPSPAVPIFEIMRRKPVFRSATRRARA
ncbi:MAG: hypothetical protein WDN01_04415 [Rhizomicrobium sp.]